MDIHPTHGLFESNLALSNLRRGKVRDVYDLPGDRLLIVATDRISAFDVVMPTPVPGKGRLLTQLSTFWLRLIESRGICRTHLVSTSTESIPAGAFVAGGTTSQELAGRSTVARKARVIPIECVVRGYVEGSGWREYSKTGAICGVGLPAGLHQCDRLEEPIFTPATKEELGRHDENITFEQACAQIGRPTMEYLRETSLKIYQMAAEHALARGIIIADTKFEFGFEVGSEAGAEGAEGARPMLIDEALTPDSSRFWPRSEYEPGRAQRSYDKQYLREWLEELVAAGKWGKQAPGPVLPADVVASTLAKYEEACSILTS
jgi:phosphoribosylaminoimidazole-succinocarboxamide synthase